MKSLTIIALTFFLFPIFPVSVWGQDVNNNQPPKEKWNLVAAEGAVTAINKETRDITLKGPDGELVTLTASDAVERFDEIAIGDIMTFEYYTYMKAEFRKPTDEEIAEPLVVLAEGGKAPEGMDPAAVVGAVVKAVVTVEILNHPNMTATVKGPRGNYLTVEMEDEALMKKLNIGQQVILTYAEAMAISLSKAKIGE
jgi:ribosomal protein L6P/L9E